MSRAKAKILRVTDLQSRYSDFVLTKKDCDLICRALLNTYKWNDIKFLYYAFKNPSRL